MKTVCKRCKSDGGKSPLLIKSFLVIVHKNNNNNNNNNDNDNDNDFFKYKTLFID